MLSQAGIAKEWGPGCYRGETVRFTFTGGGQAIVRACTVEAWAAVDAVFRAFGYEIRKSDTGGLVCRDKVGQPGVKSNHSFGFTVDFNWTTNPMGRLLVTDMPIPMMRAICAIRTRSGAQVFNWGGFWSGNKDAMHVEGVCTVKDLATGIDPRTVPPAPPYRQAATATTTTAAAVAANDKEDEMRVYSHTGEGDPKKRSLAMVVRGESRFAVNGPDQLADAQIEMGGPAIQVNERFWQHLLRTTKAA